MTTAATDPGILLPVRLAKSLTRTRVFSGLVRFPNSNQFSWRKQPNSHVIRIGTGATHTPPLLALSDMGAAPALCG